MCDKDIKFHDNDDESLITDKAFVMTGNVDAGKSTLIATLFLDTHDDGKGSARMKVARHQHEIESGRTSDISTKIITFTNGKRATLIDLCGHDKYFKTTASGISGLWPDYGVVVISPTRGVLKMTKQHFRMLMSYNIPIFIVITKIDMAIEDSCKETEKQIKKLCKKYKRSVEFINTYNDYHSYQRGKLLCDKHSITNIKDLTEEFINKIDKKELKDINKFLDFDNTKMGAINEVSQNLKLVSGKQSHIPVIYLSNVDGYFLDVVKSVMMNIEIRELWSNDENSNSIVKYFGKKLNLPKLGIENYHLGTTFYIDNAFNPVGVGIVVSGITRGDTIKLDDTLYLGPINKEFTKIKIRSLHNDNRTNIKELSDHHRGCIAIKSMTKESIRKNNIKKGMVLVSNPSMINYVGYRFEAAVTIFGSHSATLRTGYTPVIHAGTVRQPAKLIIPENEIDSEELSNLSKRERKKIKQKQIKANDVEKVWFKFILRPEYILPNTIFVFRSGEIHGLGCVIGVLPLNQDKDARPEPKKKRTRRIRPSNPEFIKVK